MKKILKTRNMSIRRKLILLFTIIILFVITLFYYILNNAFSYIQMYEEDLIKTSLVQNLSKEIKINRVKFYNATKDFSLQNKEIFLKSSQDVWDSWVKVKNMPNTSQDIFFQVEAIRYGTIAYLESTKKSLNFYKSDNEIFQTQYLKSKRVEEYVDSYLDLLINIRLQESTKLHDNQKENVARIRIISFFALVFIGIISLVFGNIFSSTITKPIIDLAKNSRLIASGNLKVKSIKLKSNDEIGVLTESFNNMATNISSMVEELKDKANIEKRHLKDQVKLMDMSKSLNEAQFLSLQSQINPHFLFNTLNTIARTSMFEQAPKTVKLIESLANIFRYNLNNQEKIVSLNNEIRILEEYMFIQKTRFGNRIDYKLFNKIDSSKVQIPIFTLQPLVENAVKHGIEPKEEGGKIYIYIDKDNEFIQIKIEDTGVGFVVNKSKQINAPESTSIGLDNVKNRLNLIFNGLEEFIIKSSPNFGTTITIKIPEVLYV